MEPFPLISVFSNNLTAAIIPPRAIPIAIRDCAICPAFKVDRAIIDAANMPIDIAISFSIFAFKFFWY